MPNEFGQNDPREPYDPENQYQSALVNLMPFVNHGLFRPLEERMKEYSRMVQSKNLKDKGMSENNI